MQWHGCQAKESVVVGNAGTPSPSAIDLIGIAAKQGLSVYLLIWFFGESDPGFAARKSGHDLVTVRCNSLSRYASRGLLPYQQVIVPQ